MGGVNDNRNIFSLGDVDNSFQLQTGVGKWAASSKNAAWIGPSNGTTGSFTADTWVHLALIRDNGTTTFYIDGVAQGSGYGVAPVVGNSSHLAVTPGGTAYFDGHIDELRIVSFATGVDSTQDVLDSLTAVPEPSSTALLGLGGLALILRRRK